MNAHWDVPYSAVAYPKYEQICECCGTDAHAMVLTECTCGGWHRLCSACSNWLNETNRKLCLAKPENKLLREMMR